MREFFQHDIVLWLESLVYHPTLNAKQSKLKQLPSPYLFIVSMVHGKFPWKYPQKFKFMTFVLWSYCNVHRLSESCFKVKGNYLNPTSFVSFFYGYKTTFRSYEIFFHILQRCRNCQLNQNLYHCFIHSDHNTNYYQRKTMILESREVLSSNRIIFTLL